MENNVKEFKELVRKTFSRKLWNINRRSRKHFNEKFPTGSLLLDNDLKGGWAKGTLIEIFGDTQSGKTTTTIHAVAEHQKKYQMNLFYG